MPSVLGPPAPTFQRPGDLNRAPAPVSAFYVQGRTTLVTKAYRAASQTAGMHEPPGNLVKMPTLGLGRRCLRLIISNPRAARAAAAARTALRAAGQEAFCEQTRPGARYAWRLYIPQARGNSQGTGPLGEGTVVWSGAEPIPAVFSLLPPSQVLSPRGWRGTPFGRVPTGHQGRGEDTGRLDAPAPLQLSCHQIPRAGVPASHAQDAVRAHRGRSDFPKCRVGQMPEILCS